MAIVKHVEKTSPFRRDIQPGDILCSVNGNKIHDLLDYMYYCAAERISITVSRAGKEYTYTHNTDYADPGIVFDSYLMDKQRRCANKCIFCFIDQLPKNMRETMYYKDDDFRLSLMYGNYVTLTNLSEEEKQRIVDLRVSPLNVSVHTTDGDLRVKMLKNPNAAEIFPLLQRFADAGINLRCQIVLCKGVNDGKALDRTLNDLKMLYPAVTSVSIVPFGKTKYRDGLSEIELFDKDECISILKQINAVGDACIKEYGTRIFYAADEFYIKAGADIPAAGFYEEFEQIENGVGMVSDFTEEFDNALAEVKGSDKSISFSLVTGEIMKNEFPKVLKKFASKFPNADIRVNYIKNNFFGPDITVTGLITGGDIIEQLKGNDLGSKLIIPEVMLRDDKFLDDVSVSDVEKALNISVQITGCSGADTVAAFVGLLR